MRLLLSAVIVGCVLSGCSSGSGVGVPVGDLPAVTGGGADRIDPAAEAAVRDVHTRVMTELFSRDERVDDPTDILDLADELTTGPLKADITESINRRLLTGYKAVGHGYESHIVSVEITGDTTASVVDCSLDTRAFYDANGALLVPADTFYRLRQSSLVLVDGRWLVSELRSTGTGRCDP
ncbi:MAG: hypothetical protein R2761_11145 [Acidimicrobiales bacterium]